MRYIGVDDSGVIINPLLFEGQIHGGLAMGIGQALLEHVAFDDASGQLLSGSFMDYCHAEGRALLLVRHARTAATAAAPTRSA